jgi:hypothetical protein
MGRVALFMNLSRKLNRVRNRMQENALVSANEWASELNENSHRDLIAPVPGNG